MASSGSWLSVSQRSKSVATEVIAVLFDGDDDHLVFVLWVVARLRAGVLGIGH